MRRSFEFLRETGPRALRRLVSRRLWSTSESFGLACDLAALPSGKRARIEMAMRPRAPEGFTGFTDELAKVSGGDYIEVAQRVRMCEAGVTTLFVASDAAGAPIYAQWLVGPEDQGALHRATPRLFPDLSAEDSLVEGAYTFSAFRKLGAMGDGMHQLLAEARNMGYRRTFTYVAAGNLPSLRGCFNAGFQLDHVRLTHQRLGRRRVERRPPTELHRRTWNEAVATTR